MEFSLATQTIYFIFSILFGVILSTLYDTVRVLRFMGFTKLWQIILTDVVYFFFCGVLTFLFSLPFNNGSVRYFVIFGEAVGFILYRFTLGEFMSKVYCFLISVIRKIFEKSLKIVIFFSNKLLKANSFVVYNVGVIIHKVQNIVFKRKGNYNNERKRIKKTAP
ncbi:MAG: spore cortex biosynthesis protein YabQ [Ruminococcus sp.]|nr:spore cortex biosynthesis protein YabQ [Ruminococcus sp.]